MNGRDAKPASPTPGRRRPSLRRRLLAFLLIPMLTALVLDALLTYGVALAYSNHVHDRDLGDDTLSLAELLRHESLPGEVSAQARFLLNYEPNGRNYFNIRSARHGLVSGNGELALPAQRVPVGQSPVLFDTSIGNVPLRAATVAIANPRDAGDTLEVTIAETLHDRHERAREILMLAIPLQALLIVAVLLLVWFGVNFGLKVLDPLTGRLGRRRHDLAPIDDSDVPSELLPLTQTIDGLFARLRELMALHERFVADAAHQLRTPLAGLALHVERAIAHPQGAELTDALGHIERLSARATRTTSQLLALTRAQTPRDEASRMTSVDLARLVPETIGERVPEAIAARVDLGYEDPGHRVEVHGDATALQELTNNLLDNAIRYAGPDGHVTVALDVDHDGRARLSVEDDGPGVAEELLPRLGERFFRAPDALEGGTGLGLAIVQRIAERHAAKVVYSRAASGGLRVEIRFPLVGNGA